MAGTYPPALPRPALLAFTKAIGSRDAALRRDECGDSGIGGAHGHVYAAPGGFQIYVMGWSTNGWNRAKQALSFAQLANDGDDEGAFFLDRLPTKAEGEAIRKWCGVPKKKEFTVEKLGELRERGRNSPKSALGPNPRYRRSQIAPERGILMTDELKPLLPADLPQDLTINTADPRYEAAVKFAKENKFTQAQFSALLAVEAHGALPKRAAAAPAAAPAPAPLTKIEGYEKMSFAQRWQAGEAARKNGRL